MLLLIGCLEHKPEAPEVSSVADGLSTEGQFRVKFKTSKGDIVIEVTPSWSPLGAARFRELVETGYFNGCRFFRVLPKFVAQFGLNGDPAVTAKWKSQNLDDEPVLTTNARGTLAFAKAGPKSRTTQIFISTIDNGNLDAMGFSPFGKVIEGIEIVDQFNAQYGDLPDQGQITLRGNEYLEAEFPNLDFIKSATIIESKASE